MAHLFSRSRFVFVSLSLHGPELCAQFSISVHAGEGPMRGSAASSTRRAARGPGDEAESHGGRRSELGRRNPWGGRNHSQGQCTLMRAEITMTSKDGPAYLDIARSLVDSGSKLAEVEPTPVSVGPTPECGKLRPTLAEACTKFGRARPNSGLNLPNLGRASINKGKVGRSAARACVFAARSGGSGAPARRGGGGRSRRARRS